MVRGMVLCLLGLLILSASALGQEQHGFRVWFNNKGDTPYSLSNPAAYLSQRAIDRRTAQGIPIDSADLPVSEKYIDTVLTLTGGKFHLNSKWLNYTVVLTDDSADILTLQGKPYIDSIEYIAYYAGGLHKPSRTTDTTGGGTIPPMKTTGSSLYYGASFQQTELVRGDYLHDIGRKGEGKLIAVIDEGFSDVDTAPAFDSLYNSGRLVDRYNYKDHHDNVFMNGSHGTTSLSTIAANLPGIYVGSAPYADYALYTTEISMGEQRIEMDNMMAASERADSIGADIITVSLGYDRFNLPTLSSLTYADIDGKTTIAAKAANIATKKGILFIASAGNEGGGSWNYILTPGDADSALTVGSVTNSKVPAPNSGFGPNSAGHIKPDVCMQGQPGYIIRTGTTPSTSLGTSIATPQLAGWAACLMQSLNNTSLTPYQIRTAIQKSAHTYNSPSAQLGYGVPDFYQALQLLNVKDIPAMPDRNNWVKVGPSPFSDNITMRVFLDRPADVHVLITDVNGRTIYKEIHRSGNGIGTITPVIPAMVPGVYFLQATAFDKSYTTRIVKR